MSVRSIDPQILAWVYIALGDNDRAFAALNKSYENHATLIWIKIGPVFDPLRSDPRFVDLLKRIPANQQRENPLPNTR